LFFQLIFPVLDLKAYLLGTGGAGGKIFAGDINSTENFVNISTNRITCSFELNDVKVG